MADFALCRGADADALAARLRGRLDQAGLSFAVLLRDDAHCLLWRCAGEAPEDAFWQPDADTWILRSGLFSHAGAAGARALRSFLAAFDPAAPDLAATRGQFTLVLHKAGRLCLLSDALGCNKIYRSEDGRLLSNLFVGVAEGLEAPRLDAQGCYEYVWTGVVGGERSFLR